MSEQVPIAIRDIKRGKAHRPFNPEGYAHQADKSNAFTGCGFTLRRIEQIPLDQTDPADRCRICWAYYAGWLPVAPVSSATEGGDNT